ncbi:hypothetical protein PUMCH_002068 [Australozyma saopauloensis]|uniref:Septin-type G domain-containing protein n=1 Tax=Australozyma saopauloensis TaxID=291208 RepID=A0AAX4HA97_9ASCO|nr:hypothetical protein PUMCH_002068 [[Candida] saopauloensis]
MADYNTSSSALRKRKTVKKTINFSFMIVGESGLGRSTFINSLCGGNTIVPTSLTATQDPYSRKLTLRHENVELEDNDGHKISLNIIDTPNFANAVNCEDDFKIVVDFIRHQYDEVLLEESRVKRNPRFKDGRIHVLLYLVNATGHGLSEIDVKFMQHVSDLVNIIPVIAKADTLTPEELKLNKQLVLEDLNTYKINYYKFNEYEYEEDYMDDEIIAYNKYLNLLIPFAVIGANTYQELKDDDEMLKLRVLNPAWALPINIELPEFNDFTILKNILLITHLNEFKELTHNVIYENYRTEALSGKQFHYNSDQRTLREDSKDNASLEAPGNYLEKEEQMKLEEERLKKFEERVHQDLLNKRNELLEREKELREIEQRLMAEGLSLTDSNEVKPVDAEA